MASEAELERMKQALLAVYPDSPTWPDKVLHKYSPAQIFAIYRKFQTEGKVR